ncbi:MAG: hypothetical protein CSA95_00835 [Bacteroidetes bacterium]|nr:MAG: hypothetical protein CSA95_00835 [Bacteroidota bacterium]PIE88150.1 MAG: hypothetical protein CSA04_03385 [Bacteroidota bacterium]
MRYAVLILLGLWSWAEVMAQVNEDFSDGELHHNPTWVGTMEDFTVNAQTSLQLDAEEAGTYYLSTENNLCDSTEWLISIQQKFSPSANNYSRIWLISDHENPSRAKGYFLQLGETGAEDVPVLYYRGEGEAFPVIRCSGPDIHTSSSHRYRIVRKKGGEWHIGTVEEGIFHEYGTGVDNRITNTKWFSITCQCTASNTDKSLFDDLQIRPVEIDTTPPEVVYVSVKEEDKLQVSFSEPPDPISATTIHHYRLTSEARYPQEVEMTPETLNDVTLLFHPPFIAGQDYTIEVKGVKDRIGNEIIPSIHHFGYHPVGVGDILISEVMADVNPAPPGLPAVEYIELYNNTSEMVNLEGYHLSINNRDMAVADSYPLLPHHYVVMTKQTIGQDSTELIIAELSIPNEACTIVLKDEEGSPVDWLLYQVTMHQESKREGGWSLERIDPNNRGGGEKNYASSQEEKGGTPGYPNSVADNNPDHTPPYVVRTAMRDPETIMLFYSEAIQCVNEQEAFHLPPQYSLREITIPEPWECRLSLKITPPLQEGEVVTMTQGEGIRDYNGNPCEPSPVKVGLPGQATTGDIVINEVLFNPEEGFYDYAELWNRSAHVIDLAGFLFAEYDTLSGKPYNWQTAVNMPYLLFPGDYLLITRDTTGFSRRYPTAGRAPLLRGAYLPPMPDHAGSLALLQRHNGAVMDFMTYHSAMHYPLLFNQEGVSLERVTKETWLSSGELNHFGTPGYANSQRLNSKEATGTIEIWPKVITPDNDGRNDVGTITLFSESLHEVADIYVYDRAGYRIRKLKENVLLSTESVLVWDGCNDKGRVVPPGYYVVVASLRNRFGMLSPLRASIAVGL